MHTARTLIAAAIMLAVPAVAQQRQPAPFGAAPEHAMMWIIGEWRGGGTMFGRPSEATFRVSPVLGGRFLEFSYRAGPFEGRAFYRAVANGRWEAHWFDNRGVTFPIEAREIERTLTSDWGSPETEQGRTVYRLTADGRLHITDSVRRDGSYREFATHVLTRAN